jgi:hypothetical protein
MLSGAENEKKNEEQVRTSRPRKDVPLPFVGEKELQHQDVPPPMPADKQIHRRRPLPPVPEAPPRNDNSAAEDSDSGDSGTE